ncbi:hypothetical protein MDA_GLEAN10000690 [Myotis davidii]|uniref:Uncharacterized protein n=1 Tax=Myotis davidii TaxID=225400 RepID=L5M7Z5_MYODS|nr:hypothetical protein MDA_GLEAN10000690 [Myotis davidii]
MGRTGPGTFPQSFSDWPNCGISPRPQSCTFGVPLFGLHHLTIRHLSRDFRELISARSCKTLELPPGGQCTPTGVASLSQKLGSQLVSAVAVAGASPTSVVALRMSSCWLRPTPQEERAYIDIRTSPEGSRTARGCRLG